jgi:hypothetical protein
LQWLQDSDYDPICLICRKRFDEDEGSIETVRLNCLDIFHVGCINEMCNNLCENNSKATEFSCPSCSVSIIPPDNIVGKIATNVRNTFKNTQWYNQAKNQKSQTATIDTNDTSKKNTQTETARKTSTTSTSQQPATVVVVPLETVVGQNRMAQSVSLDIDSNTDINNASNNREDDDSKNRRKHPLLTGASTTSVLVRKLM